MDKYKTKDDLYREVSDLPPTLCTGYDKPRLRRYDTAAPRSQLRRLRVDTSVITYIALVATLHNPGTWRLSERVKLN